MSMDPSDYVDEENDILSLQGKIEEKDSEIEDLESEILSLNDQLKNLWQQRQNEIDSLNNSFQSERNSTAANIQQVQNEKQQLQAQIDGLNNERQQRQNEIDSLNNSFQSERNSTAANIQQVQNEKQQLQAQIDSLNQQVNNLNTSFNNERTQLENKVKSTENTFQTDLNTKQGEIVELKNQLTELQKDITNANADLLSKLGIAYGDQLKDDKTTQKYWLYALVIFFVFLLWVIIWRILALPEDGFLTFNEKSEYTGLNTPKLIFYIIQSIGILSVSITVLWFVSNRYGYYTKKVTESMNRKTVAESFLAVITNTTDQDMRSHATKEVATTLFSRSSIELWNDLPIKEVANLVQSLNERIK